MRKIFFHSCGFLLVFKIFAMASCQSNESSGGPELASLPGKQALAPCQMSPWEWGTLPQSGEHFSSLGVRIRLPVGSSGSRGGEDPHPSLAELSSSPGTRP